MNNLFSGSWANDPSSPRSSALQMSRSNSAGPIGSAAAAGGANLNRFFEDVESIKDELKEIELAHRRLHDSNESLKTAHSSAAAVRDVRRAMDADVALALKKAKLIKLRLESLERSNAANRSAAGCGPGTSTDRTRTSVVGGLRRKLRDQMEAFGELRGRAAAERREAAGRRYYAATGEEADEGAVEAMAMAEERGEGVLRSAAEEMRERRGAAEELERSLVELQQVFLDMAVMVEEQGQQMDDIESQVGRARSFVDRGTQQLQEAKRQQRSARKWTCVGIVLLVVVVLIIVLPIVLKK